MVTPLRAVKESTGETYTRIPEIEAKLKKTESLSRDDLVARFEITNKADPGYLPTECLVYHVRACRADNSTRGFDRLYKLLLHRFLRHLPGGTGQGDRVSLTRDEIGHDTLAAFQELLAADRDEYADRLDYFEIRFDGAVAKLRHDARKKAWRHENRTTPLALDDETGEIFDEVERAAGSFDLDPEKEIVDRDYRKHVEAAIDSLNPLQRQIVQMRREGFPFYSEDLGVVDIAHTLKKADKTVRSQYDKAIKLIQSKLSGEEK